MNPWMIPVPFSISSESQAVVFYSLLSYQCDGIYISLCTYIYVPTSTRAHFPSRGHSLLLAYQAHAPRAPNEQLPANRRISVRSVVVRNLGELWTRK